MTALIRLIAIEINCFQSVTISYCTVCEWLNGHKKNAMVKVRWVTKRQGMDCPYSIFYITWSKCLACLWIGTEKKRKLQRMLQTRILCFVMQQLIMQEGNSLRACKSSFIKTLVMHTKRNIKNKKKTKKTTNIKYTEMSMSDTLK